MKHHITVVYYDSDSSVLAFHVINADEEKLQNEFDKNDIVVIKCITIESEASYGRGATTLFTESDIKNFLDEMKINF